MLDKKKRVSAVTAARGRAVISAPPGGAGEVNSSAPCPYHLSVAGSQLLGSGKGIKGAPGILLQPVWDSPSKAKQQEKHSSPPGGGSSPKKVYRTQLAPLIGSPTIL